ncbi:MAG: glycosyltransferase [Lachnospiraceae bacterium]|nr:glycosyltransferase [Lachnospiraceae bacterium]
MTADNEMIEVIYIAYRPDERLYESLKRIAVQAAHPDRIRIVLTVDDAEAGLTDAADCVPEQPKEAKEVARKLALAGLDRKVKIETVSKHEFSHGATRQKAVMSSQCGYVLLMTQDAVPVNGRLISNLLKAVSGMDAALAYARQVPYPDASKVERLYRLFNYPRKSVSKTASDIEKMGVKAFFSSDVCCMYKKSVFEQLGGFDTSIDFNEDSIFAYHALKAGYTVEYAAEALVFHSHNMSFKEMFERSRVLAISQKQHKDIFGQVSSENEGMKFLRLGLKALWKRKDYLSAAELIATCIAKYAGYFVGKNL